MWNDPIVEETRRLRDEYSAKLNYSVHAIAEDLKQLERQGFPMPADPEGVLYGSGHPERYPKYLRAKIQQREAKRAQ